MLWMTHMGMWMPTYAYSLTHKCDQHVWLLGTRFHLPCSPFFSFSSSVCSNFEMRARHGYLWIHNTLQKSVWYSMNSRASLQVCARSQFELAGSESRFGPLEENKLCNFGQGCAGLRVWNMDGMHRCRPTLSLSGACSCGCHVVMAAVQG